MRTYVAKRKSFARGKEAGGGLEEELKLAREGIAEKNRRLKKLRGRLEEKDREIEQLRAKPVQRDASLEAHDA